jgi:hypothetical protein
MIRFQHERGCVLFRGARQVTEAGQATSRGAGRPRPRTPDGLAATSRRATAACRGRSGRARLLRPDLSTGSRCELCSWAAAQLQTAPNALTVHYARELASTLIKLDSVASGTWLPTSTDSAAPGPPSWVPPSLYSWRLCLPTAPRAPFSKTTCGLPTEPGGQRRSRRISTRGKPPETAVVSAALVKPASSKTVRIPT